jgi:hypothetical protein
MMNCRRFGRKRLWPAVRHCSGIYLRGSAKNAQDDRCVYRDSNEASTEWKSEELRAGFCSLLFFASFSS